MSKFKFSWQRHGILLALLLIAGGLFIPPYAASFIGDDYVQLWRIRDLVLDPSGAWAVFGPTWTTWYYRPLQNLWILANRLVWGYDPQPFYLLQIGIHLLAGALLYRLARRLHLPVWAAIGGAAFFLISGIHQQSVGWIASIAIVLATMLSLLAAVSFARYVDGEGAIWLVGAVAAWVLALTASESAIVLPLILVALHGARRPKPTTYAGALVAVAIMIGYVALQATRPNAHLSIGDASGGTLMAAVRPDEIARFLAAATGRFATGRVITFANPVAVFLGVLIAGGLIVGLMRGNRAVRFGLWWAAMYMGFVYVAIWVQDAAVFDNRHLYAAWAGLALTGAAAAPAIVESYARPKTIRRALGAILLGFLILQGTALRANQQRWETLAEQASSVEESLKSRLPAVNADTRLFATRFIYTPPYFAPTAAVWYEKPQISGGTLADLRRHDVLTPDFYLFDQTDEFVIYELMPSLHAHQHTQLVWKGPPDEALEVTAGGSAPLADESYAPDGVAGPAGNPRLSVRVEARVGITATLGYGVEEIPAGASLAFGYRAVPDTRFQVRWTGKDGTEEILFTGTPRQGMDAWSDELIDVSTLAGHSGTLWFDTWGAPGAESTTAYWANPRFVWD